MSRSRSRSRRQREQHEQQGQQEQQQEQDQHEQRQQQQQRRRRGSSSVGHDLLLLQQLQQQSAPRSDLLQRAHLAPPRLSCPGRGSWVQVGGGRVAGGAGRGRSAGVERVGG